MSGVEFERFLKSYFEWKGFQVFLTKASGDQGVDLILLQNQRKIAVQAKRYAPLNPIRNSAIQEVAAGELFHDCNESYVITTSYYTNSARTLANKIGVKLIDRNQLIKMIEDNLNLI